jgi:hypothetical protein
MREAGIVVGHQTQAGKGELQDGMGKAQTRPSACHD